MWLVGSLAKRKVVSVAADGSTADMFSSPDMLRVLGIHVDSARDLVWFATWAPVRASNADSPDLFRRTRLFKADLTIARIIRRSAAIYYSNLPCVEVFPLASRAAGVANPVSAPVRGDVALREGERLSAPMRLRWPRRRAA